MVRYFVSTVFVILFAASLRGDESVAELTARVKNIQDFVLKLKADHEKRFEQLETANEKLHKELGKAKAEIRRKDELIEKAREAGFGNRKEYLSSLHILSGLPDDLQPDTKPGWDGFTLGKVAAWLKKEPTGEPFRKTLKVYQASVAKNVSSTKNAPPYVLSIRFSGETLKYKNQALFEYVAPSVNGTFKLYGDEAFARNAAEIEPGDLFEVRGRIREVDLKTYTSSGPRKCWILLTGHELTPTKAEE